MFSVVAREVCCTTILTMARWKDLKVPPLQKVSMKEMGLAHSARNLGLSDSAGEEYSCDHRCIQYSGWGLELKRRLGQGKIFTQCCSFVVCSVAVRNTSLRSIMSTKNSANHSIGEFFLGSHEPFLPT